VLHHQLLEQPPAALAPCYTFSGAQFKPLLSLFALQSPIASCSCGVPLETPASSRACLAIVYPLVFLWHPSNNARILTGSPCKCVSPCALAASLQQCSHSNKQANAQSMTKVVVGLPLLPYYSLGLPPNALFILVVRIPLLPYPLGLRPNVLFVVIVGLPSLPYFLELPPNAPFVVVIGQLLPPCSLSCYICLCIQLTPIAFLYALFVAYCCCHVWCRCSEGKLYVRPLASRARSSRQDNSQAVPHHQLHNEAAGVRLCFPN
jgi:hypothetical protein